MFAFFTSLSKRAKYSKLCVFLTDQESDTQWGRDHRNLIEAFVYSEFDMTNIWSILFLVYYGIYNLICLKWQSSFRCHARPPILGLVTHSFAICEEGMRDELRRS